MEKFLKGVQSFVLLVTRVGFAGLLFWHGWQKIADGSGAMVPLLEQIGFPFPTISFWALVALEIGGSVLLAVGFLTRLVAAAFVAEFTLAILWIHWWNGFWIADNGYEYAGVCALLALVFVAFGAGIVAIDHALFRKKDKEPEPTPY
jgi:putative oxidoreductase